MRRAVKALCAASLALAAAVATASPASAVRQADAPNYQVDVVNHAGLGLDEVDLAVGRFSDPVIRLQTQRHVVSGATVTFDLGPCSDVRQFAASAFVGNREVLHTGDINPSPNCHTQVEITHT
ncbi:hypothetical protein [Streptomyces beijiangensis]|uniref:Uncharacterized protein n=1 Tax=Streptomyces beijiangensis TaxID=163361 RepID=A0A939FCB0_9ACTN|nr:hypothetical protein [Streptomyces beijiangensis]MBO0515591.1 hypothetical protein [Streptomyces beijiangensis]